MQPIKCLLLLGLLVATVSAAPGIISKLHETIAETASESVSHTVGGNFGLGPFQIGANLNIGHSKSQANAAALNSESERYRRYAPTYGFSGAHATASAVSEAHSANHGPYPYGISSAQSEAKAIATTDSERFRRYAPVYGVSDARAEAVATSDARSYGGADSIAQAQAHSTASAINANYHRFPRHTFSGSRADASAVSDSHSYGLNFGPIPFGISLNHGHSEAKSSASAINERYRRFAPVYGFNGAHAQATAISEAHAANHGAYPYGISSAHSQAEAIATAANERYRRYAPDYGFSGAHAEATAESLAQSFGGAHLSDARAQAHSSANAGTANYAPIFRPIGQHY